MAIKVEPIKEASLKKFLKRTVYPNTMTVVFFALVPPQRISNPNKLYSGDIYRVPDL